MQPTTQVCAVESPVVASQDGASYEGIRLVTDDPEKVIPFVDQILFYLRVQGFKTRPVAISENQGVVDIRWSGRRPRAFNDRMFAVTSFGEHLDCFQIAAREGRSHRVR